MRILVYSETTGASVASNLGQAEYSYYFILEKYLPVLQELGEVVPVSQPETEVDNLYAQARDAGDICVFLSFTPPHRTPRDLSCPTIAVLAWEFDRIPDESWDGNPWNNWVDAIRQIGAVVTISDYATRVVRRQVGGGVVVETIPAPIAVPGETPSLWQRLFPRSLPALRRAPGGGSVLQLDAGIIDSSTLHIDAEGVSPVSGDDSDIHAAGQRWPGSPVDWDFSLDGGGDSQYLLGFYEEEHWGSWSKTARPSVILPWLVSGEVELEMDLQAYGENIGRELRVVLGSQEQCVTLPAQLQRHTLKFDLPAPGVARIQFLGLSAIAASGARDHRTLGLGLANLSLRRPAGGGESAADDAKGEGEQLLGGGEQELRLSGAVYTSIFNPVDGRKNWEDMVTAFCWAFRDDPEKTLVLKMSHHNRSTFLGKLLLLFSRLSPFRCRVVAIHGYLSMQQMQGLVGATDFFVNTSLAEGQCLPLLEFMAQGVPAISPDHTAMQTYIHAGNSLVVRSSPQPHIWPNDPRRAYRTTSNRIDWDALRQCYLASDALEPDQYQTMSRAARDVVARHYSAALVRRRLRRTIQRVVKARNPIGQGQ